MSFRIFITGSNIAAEALELLKNQNCIYQTGDPLDSADDIARQLSEFEADGLIVRQGKITAAVQDASKNLKVISKHGVGTDNIDLQAATQRGIPVMFTPGANQESVAQHALALILSLLRRIPDQNRRIREGIFDKKNYDGMELYGKTLGLIGYGNVARRLAELVAPFCMKVIVYHPSQTDEALSPYISKTSSSEEIFAAADIISLHCPLTEDTQNLINRDSIARMKKGTYIINTARGGIVNESDLSEALHNGHIGGAALDVFEIEPLPADTPLLQLPNVILTSHIAGSSNNSLQNMGLIAVRNALSVLRGEDLNMKMVVNKEVLASLPL